MVSSVFLAKLIGAYMAIIAAGFLINRKIYYLFIENFSKSPALTYMGASFSLIIGLLIVLVHNMWIWRWPVIITIFGWLALIKGIILVIFPGLAVKLTQVYHKREGLLAVNLIIFLLFGILLVIRGYFG